MRKDLLILNSLKLRVFTLSVKWLPNLKADQKAFNLLYAFYNYPKAFYLVSLPLAANNAQLEDAIESQLFNQPKLDFLNTAIKTNPMGQQVNWMKSFIVQQALDMKVRIQTCLN